MPLSMVFSVVVVVEVVVVPLSLAISPAGAVAAMAATDETTMRPVRTQAVLRIALSFSGSESNLRPVASPGLHPQCQAPLNFFPGGAVYKKGWRAFLACPSRHQLAKPAGSAGPEPSRHTRRA